MTLKDTSTQEWFKGALLKPAFVIAPKVGISGRFRWEKRKAGTDIVTHPGYGFQPNLITNRGLDSLEVPSNANIPFYRLVIGSGNSTPSFTDTQLDAPIAVSSVIGNGVWTIDTPNRYLVWTVTITYSAPTAAGNISELGLSDTAMPFPANAQLLVTRALILDELGSPTTITVLPDEDLVVVYQIRVKQPAGDFPFTLPSGHTGVARTALADTLANASGGYMAAIGWGWVPNSGFPRIARSAFGQSIANGVRMSPNSLGTITGSPTGLVNTLGSGYADLAYTPGTHFRSFTYTIATNILNGVALRSVVWRVGPCCFQAEWSPTITKNNTQTLRIGFGLSWGRG